MKTSKNGLFLALLALTCISLIPTMPASAAATITIVNTDGPNEGFNDPTPAAPVGGNPGTTVGQQRLNVFAHAAGIWGATLDSNVVISVLSRFNPLTCTATQAVLGSAGSIQAVFVTGGGAGIPPFPGLEASTFYGTALANKRLGFDAIPGPPGTTADDIVATFNSNLNGNPACLGGIGWYYGFDGNHGANIDLETVVLHELGHGLNFQQFASVTSGALLGSVGGVGGLPDVFNKRIFDVTTGKTWPQMTNAERVASAINTRKVVWTGVNVQSSVPGVLSLGVPLLRVNTPPGIAGAYDVGRAQFGPPLTSTAITGNVVQALDPALGGTDTAFDACSPLTNAAAINNNIALVDRGACLFPVKVKNAQDAGAIAVIVADNVAGSPPADLGGADPTINIPSVRVTLPDGNKLKANLAAGVNASLLLDLSVRAGTEPSTGLALLYTPNPVVQGSTISHWDTSAFRNLLMEPAINADLTHSVMPPEDLTLPLLRDIGWFKDRNLNGVPDEDELLSGVSPAEVWIGLKNSDDVGTYFDLKAEVMKNGSVIGSGQTNNVRGGSSGFNNAVSRTIDVALSGPDDVLMVPGDILSIRLSARIGASGHRSGTARLWFNDSKANSGFFIHFTDEIFKLYLQDSFKLDVAPGPGPKKTIDVTVDRAKNGNAFKAFGTWSKTF